MTPDMTPHMVHDLLTAHAKIITTYQNHLDELTVRTTVDAQLAQEDADERQDLRNEIAKRDALMRTAIDYLEKTLSKSPDTVQAVHAIRATLTTLKGAIECPPTSSTP